MSIPKVLRLDEYRDRRAQRLRLAEALYRPDPRRLAVFRHLSEVADLACADRAATVWVDEYGSGLVHPHVVLDQLCDRPRRTFAGDTLREAWQLGVPSACDRLARPAAAIPASFAVSLGSDGTRAWFLIAESLAPRAPLDEASRDRIMFLAGECAAVLLHRDLDALCDDVEAGARPRFAGWHILEDLEGREEDEAEGRRIAQRFVVARLVRMLIEDDLVTAPERIVEQVRRARTELAGPTAADEAPLWERVLDALEGGELNELASTLVELGDAVDAQGHSRGAAEIYECGYAISSAIGASRQAANAARLYARLFRRQAMWSAADDWFDTALQISEEAGLPDIATHALVGSADIKRETGNLPAARRGFHRALEVAKRSGDGDAIGVSYHALMGLEQQSGDLSAALEHGWCALANYVDQVRRTRCMAGIAGVLIDCGDLQAAEDAWTLVARASNERYYLTFAYDALGHLAALRGDEQGFEAYSSRCDALDWQSGTNSAKAEILYHRGVSYRALGRVDRAREWLEEALAFAEQHKYTRIIFRAEESLADLAQSVAPVAEQPVPAAPQHVRDGLKAMRRELVGAAF